MSENPSTALAKVEMDRRGVQIRSVEDARVFANIAIQSGLLPKDFNTPQKVFIAIQYGAEIGLSPTRSLQSIAVINGRPCVWGDALPALVRSSGLCEYITERVEGDGEKMVAVCVSKRKDAPEPQETRFSVADAKTAGLWGKAGPWKNYPKRMLQMRARAFNLRDNFADALGGMAVREEVMDIIEGEAFDPSKMVGPPDDSKAEADPLLAKALNEPEPEDAEIVGEPMTDEEKRRIEDAERMEAEADAANAETLY